MFAQLPPRLREDVAGAHRGGIPLEQLRCPTCKRTGEEIKALETALFGDLPNVVAAPAAMPDVAATPAAIEVPDSDPVPFLEEDVAALSQPQPDEEPELEPKQPSPEDEPLGAPVLGIPAEPLGASEPCTQAYADDAPASEISSAVKKQPQATTHPTFAEPSVYCGNCDSMCSIMNTRVLAKGNKTFRCLKCCTRVTQLFRQHGHWPTPEFKQLSVPDQKKFFQDIATVASAAELLRAKTEEYFEKFNTSQDFYEESGQFLPLSVWDRKGFSTEDIVANSVEADTAIHPVLGPVYRVKLLTKGSKGSIGVDP